MPDNINPEHYKEGPIECIEVIKASMTPEGFEGYLKGSIFKYLWRYERKHLGNEVEDLLKAEWFLKRLIQERVDDNGHRETWIHTTDFGRSERR